MNDSYLEKLSKEEIIELLVSQIDFSRELQERIDKVIELIKQYDNTFIEMNLAIKLREILKGEKE